MKKAIRKFFGIEKDGYIFEWTDITATLTVLNVALIVTGVSWAAWIGIINCILNLVLNVKFKSHINMYVMQVALVILNIYFLSL